MRKVSNASEYVASQDKWKEEIILLRELCLQTELEETIKWGIPTYTYRNNNIVGIASFKNHCALWFHQGVFLKDPKKILINANKEQTKGLRQLRFKDKSEINPEIILEYLKESIQNEKEGKRIRPQKTAILTLPEELSNFFKENPRIKDQFNQLTAYKQKEYAEFIGSAKKQPTRIKRLEKSIPLIQKGLGLNDKYRD